MQEWAAWANNAAVRERTFTTPTWLLTIATLATIFLPYRLSLNNLEKMVRISFAAF